MLLPGLVVGFWRIVGSEYSWVPAAVASLFAALSIAIMCSSVSALTKDNRGWLFGLVLLATPGYLIQPAYQMADFPLGVYFLATVVLLQFANALPQIRKHLLILAGLSAGLAGWTKDEGLLFIVVLLALFTLTFAISRSWRAFFHHMCFFGAGLGPVLVLIISFKIFLARPDTMFRGQSYIELLTDSQRYAQIAAAFLDQTFHFGLATINPILLVAFCLVLYGVPIESVRITRFSFSLLLLTPAMLVGYFVVYAISPYDLSWHLSSSLDRLLLQLWPMLVFSLAMISVPIGER